MISKAGYPIRSFAYQSSGGTTELRRIVTGQLPGDLLDIRALRPTHVPTILSGLFPTSHSIRSERGALDAGNPADACHP